MYSFVDSDPDSDSNFYRIKSVNKYGESGYTNEFFMNTSEKLKNSEDKIIDIAFDVGFESFSTFNRVFKNLMEKTPIECRVNN